MKKSHDFEQISESNSNLLFTYSFCRRGAFRSPGETAVRKFLASNIEAMTAILSCAGTAKAGTVPPIPASFVTAADPGQALLQTVQYAPNGANNSARNRTNQRPGARAPSREAFRDRGYYDRNYGSVRRDDSSALAAGFPGFVIGAAIAGSANDRTYATTRLSDQSWTANCTRKYRSFDARSGIYLGFDGYRHYCR